MTTYGMLYGLAMLSGVGVFVALATRRHRVPLAVAYPFAAATVTGAWIGAQIAGVATNLWTHGEWVLPVLHGGTGASWGGILGGLLVGIWLRRRIVGHGNALLSAAVPAIPVVQAIGRAGCFAAGCDYGKPTGLPWAVTYSTDSAVPDALVGIPLHPVQLYEALFCALLACHMIRTARAGTSSLHNVALYATGYATARFALEFFRGDVDRGVLPAASLSLAQAVALACLAFAGAAFLARRRPIRPSA